MNDLKLIYRIALRQSRLAQYHPNLDAIALVLVNSTELEIFQPHLAHPWFLEPLNRQKSLTHI